MTSEDIGGECPLCGNFLLMVYDSGSHGTKCDACLSCGFAYGTHEMVGLSPHEVMCEVFLRFDASFGDDLEKFKRQFTSHDTTMRRRKSIFNYEGTSQEDLQSMCSPHYLHT